MPLESLIFTADTSAMEGILGPGGKYSRPFRLTVSRICSGDEIHGRSIRGYIVSTESLKGTRDTETDPRAIHSDIHIDVLAA